MPKIIKQCQGKIIDETDRILFKEFTDSIKVKAYRAAYIILWICCAESLKRKFKQLAIRDGEILKVISEIEQKESNHQSVDKLILEKAKGYGLILDTEFSKLLHIYEMRCIYGHPYEEKPSLAELESTALIVTDTVLSRPPKLRQGFLSHQVELLSTDLAYLDDLFEPVQEYATLIYERTASDLHLWFLNKLWKAFPAPKTDPTVEIFVKRCVWFSQVYIELGIKDFFPKWDVVSDLTNHPTLLTRILSSQKLFPLLEKHAKDIVVGNLIQEGKRSGLYLKKITMLHESKMLDKRQELRFLEVIDLLPYDYLCSIKYPAKYYSSKIIEALKSHNWYVQNPAIENLKIAGFDSIASIDKKIQILLGNNVLQSAEGNAKEAIVWLKELATGIIQPWPTSFIEGIISECFYNDSRILRFKIEYLQEALLSIRNLKTKKQRKKIVENVLEEIKLGLNPKKCVYGEKELKIVLKTIKSVVDTDVRIYGQLSKVYSLLENYTPEYN